MPDPNYDLFISHAEADRAWVEGYLLDALDRAGVRHHRETAFALGVPRILEFEKAVKDSRRILLVLSPAYFANDTAQFVDLLAQTFGLETSTWPVIPLVLEPAPLPTRLSMLTKLEATTPEAREEALGKLCALFQRPLPAPPARRPCPYPGMSPFALDRDGQPTFPFFGRDREAEKLLQALRKNRFLTVIGSSGSGKSSLVLAGLVPRLRASGLFGPCGWRILVMRPTAEPFAELRKTLDADPADSAAAVAHALAVQPDARRLLLVVDQCEELFTVAEGDTRNFQQALVQLAEVPDAHVVLTVRADFYDELMASRLLWPAIQRNREEIAPLDEAGLREAIHKPAETVGVYVESALVERLAADAAGSPGVLPLVQETLVLLWEKLERRLLPLRSYESLILTQSAYSIPEGEGRRTGLEVAIAQHAESVIASFAGTPRAEIARRIFLRLIQFGEGRPNTRRQQTVAQLRAGHDPVEFAQVLKHLTDNRLLTQSGDEQTGRRKADVAHEALIVGWPQLRGWITEHRAAEEVRRDIEAKASAWIAKGRGDAGLLDRVDLPAADQWLAGPDGRDLDDADPVRDLVSASHQAIEEAERRRDEMRRRELDNARKLATEEKLRVRLFRRWAIAMGVALVLMAGALVWAVKSSRRANLNETLAKSSEEKAKTSEQDAIANALEANREKAEANREKAEALTISGVSAFEQGHSFDAMYRFAYAVAAVSDDHVEDQVNKVNINRLRLRFLEGNVPHLRDILSGHVGSVTCAAFSPDGLRVVTASDDGTARVYEADNGKFVELKGHDGPVRSAAFSPDGSHVVTASDDRTARVWDMATAVGVELKGHGGPVNAAAFSPDGSHVVTASDDRTARIWNTETGKFVELKGHVEPVNAAAFDRPGDRVVTGSDDGTARIWNVGTGQEVGRPGVDLSKLFSVAFSPDGTRIVTASANGDASVWELSSGEKKARMFGHVGVVTSAAFSPDMAGASILTASSDGTARIWDVSSQQQVNELKGHVGWVHSAAFSRDGTRIVTASDDGTARVWEKESGNFVELKGHDDAVSFAAFSPDGSRVVTASRDGTARVHDAASGILVFKPLVRTERLKPYDFRPKNAPEGIIKISFGGKLRLPVAAYSGLDIVFEVNSAAFSRDGARLVTASDDGLGRVWEAASGNMVRELKPPHGGPVTSAAFSPDGSHVVTASDDSTARVWEVASGKFIELKGHQGPVTCAGFSPTGSRIVTASRDATARVWEAASGEFVELNSHSHPLNPLTDRGWVPTAAFSPDGSRVVTTTTPDAKARIWDAATCRRVAVLTGHGSVVGSAAFSPDGSRVVTGSWDWSARVWDATSGRPVAEMDGHNSWIVAVAFSPNGSRVVTGSRDGTARVWDAASGRLVAVLRGHGGEVHSAAFSPDGSRVVTASNDHTARVWTLDALPGEPETLPDWVEVYTGTELSIEGVVRPISASEWKERCQNLLRKHQSAVPPIPWLRDRDTAAKTNLSASAQ